MESNLLSIPHLIHMADTGDGRVLHGAYSICTQRESVDDVSCCRSCPSFKLTDMQLPCCEGDDTTPAAESQANPSDHDQLMGVGQLLLLASLRRVGAYIFLAIHLKL